MAKTPSSSDPADPSPDPQPPRDGHDQRPDEGGRMVRFLAVVCGGVFAAAVILCLRATIAEVPRGRSIVWLELAGTTARAKEWLAPADAANAVSIPEIHQALLADLLLIAF